MGKTYGVIHLVGAQNVPGNWGLLPPDARRLCAYQGVRNIRFLEHFACVLVEWSRGMLAWGLGCSGSGGVFCGLGSWGGGGVGRVRVFVLGNALRVGFNFYFSGVFW